MLQDLTEEHARHLECEMPFGVAGAEGDLTIGIGFLNAGAVRKDVLVSNLAGGFPGRIAFRRTRIPVCSLWRRCLRHHIPRVFIDGGEFDTVVPTIRAILIASPCRYLRMYGPPPNCKRGFKRIASEGSADPLFFGTPAHGNDHVVMVTNLRRPEPHEGRCLAARKVCIEQIQPMPFPLGHSCLRQINQILESVRSLNL